jgi:hypothetical protein
MKEVVGGMNAIIRNFLVILSAHIQIESDVQFSTASAHGFSVNDYTAFEVKCAQTFQRSKTASFKVSYLAILVLNHITFRNYHRLETFLVQDGTVSQRARS